MKVYDEIFEPDPIPEPRVSVWIADNKDGSFQVSNGDAIVFPKLPPETARNLAHEILRRLEDKCPCHREDLKHKWNTLDGRWSVER